METRKSTETDRRHLLADSVAPSTAASLLSYGDGDATPRARSPARDLDSAHPAPERRQTIAATPKPYRGFPSEEAYLDALRQWAESRKYITHDTALIGFYGHKTMEDIANQPHPEMHLGLRKKWRARKDKKAEQQTARRNTVA